jgi:hypothetical protein
MNNREFMYWLWGYFDLSGARPLDEKQLLLVEEHLKLVKENQLYSGSFTEWLSGLMDLSSAIEPKDVDMANEAVSNLIYEKLKREFEGDIEPIEYKSNLHPHAPVYSC